MPSTAILARGTTIGVDNADSPYTYTTIPNITSIGGPSSTTAEIEVTDLSSTAKEYLLDLVDNGTVQLQGFYEPNDATQEILRASNVAGTSRNYQITFTTTSPNVTFTFDARVAEFSTDESVANAIGLTVGLRVTGAITKA